MRSTVFTLLVLVVAWLTGSLVSASLLHFFTPSSSSVARASCGRPLVVNVPNGEVLRAESTRVLLALDEEWQERFGDDADSVARSLVAEASALFRNVDIHLLPVGIQAWRSPDDVRSAPILLKGAAAAIPLGDADILIALTAQSLDRIDGFADPTQPHLLVKHHPDHPSRDAYVLAHEVAHLFGARHGCDLPGRRGLMARSGFEEPVVVCPCTKRALEMNVDRFHDRLAD